MRSNVADWELLHGNLLNTHLPLCQSSLSLSLTPPCVWFLLKPQKNVLLFSAQTYHVMESTTALDQVGMAGCGHVQMMFCPRFVRFWRQNEARVSEFTTDFAIYLRLKQTTCQQLTEVCFLRSKQPNWLWHTINQGIRYLIGVKLLFIA